MIELCYRDIEVIPLESLVDPDGLDLGPLGHGVDQGHELAVRGELPGLDHVQGGVSGVFLNNDAQRISMSLIFLNLILDESVAIEHSGGLHISSIRGCLLTLIMKIFKRCIVSIPGMAGLV